MEHSSSQFNGHFDEIKNKIKRMKTRIGKLESENQELRKSIFTYLEQLAAQKKETQNLSQKQKNASLANSLSLPNHELNKEIDKYILILDKCIATINTKL